MLRRSFLAVASASAAAGLRSAASAPQKGHAGRDLHPPRHEALLAIGY